MSKWVDTLVLIWGGVTLLCLRGNPAPLNVPCLVFPFVNTQGIAADGVDNLSHQNWFPPQDFLLLGLPPNMLMLCVLLTVMLLFSLTGSLCCTSLSSIAPLPSLPTLAVGCCSTLLMPGAPLVMGFALHDKGGSPGGCLTPLGCDGGGMPLLVNMECSGKIVP